MIDEEASAVMREDREDGEFWMEIGDFVRFFSKAFIGLKKKVSFLVTSYQKIPYMNVSLSRHLKSLFNITSQNLYLISYKVLTVSSL